MSSGYAVAMLTLQTKSYQIFSNQNCCMATKSILIMQNSPKKNKKETFIMSPREPYCSNSTIIITSSAYVIELYQNF